METEIVNVPLQQKSAVGSFFSPRAMARMKERVIELALSLTAFTSVAITAEIVGVLVYESFHFFQHVSVLDFLTDR